MDMNDGQIRMNFVAQLRELEKQIMNHELPLTHLDNNEGDLFHVGGRIRNPIGQEYYWFALCVLSETQVYPEMIRQFVCNLNK